MPLRALHNGRDVVAPLSADDWSALCTAVSADRMSLQCPECAGRTVPRISKLGLQHFYHFRRSPDCTSYGETEQHRKAKTEIVLGCRDAGYTPLTEYAGQGWRADVYAERGTTKLAFEVQWSHQYPEDFQFRQERYKRDNVRACWFVRSRSRLAKWSLLELHEGESKSLPSFRLIARESGMEVQIGNRILPLRQFVSALLSRRVRFRQSVRAERTEVELGVAGHACQCGYEYNTCHLIGEWQVSPCGLKFGFQDYHGAISPTTRLSIIRKFLQSDQGRSLRTKLIEKHYEWRTDSYWTFVCPKCDASAPSYVFHSNALNREKSHVFDSVLVPIDRPMTKSRDEDVPHWCFSESGLHC